MENIIATASASIDYTWVIPLLVGFAIIPIGLFISVGADSIGNGTGSNRIARHSPLKSLKKLLFCVAGTTALIGALTSAVGTPCTAAYLCAPNNHADREAALNRLTEIGSEFENRVFQMKEYGQKDLGNGYLNIHMGLFGGSVYGLYTTDQCLAVIYEIPDQFEVYRAFRLNLEKTEIRSCGNASPYFLLDTKIEEYDPCHTEAGYIDNCSPDGKTNYRLVLSGYSYLYLPDGWEIY